MANLWIENHGVYTISDQKVQDLIQWVQTNGGVTVESGQSKPQADGETLLNETPQQPQPEPNGKTYDFGTKWI
jgi:D-serine dehydratase